MTEARMHTTTQSASRAVLYLIATPIGNLEDITLRALRVLKEVSIIACEDTRTSGVLLAHYGITTPTLSYHEHNGEVARPKILSRLAAGESVALISDAGTPLISDPGYKLVREVAEAGHAVVPIPGASSVLSALIASGLPTDHFTFSGFLPSKHSTLEAWLKGHTHTLHTLVVFESPHRVRETLSAMRAVWGDGREICLARELTKTYETFVRGTTGSVYEHYKTHEAPRGEIVLIIGPGAAPITTAADIDALLTAALATHSVKEAASIVADATGTPKRELYQRALALKSSR
jgi:16S rRNA (cytidine1402-2'-O)-methyltransferase